MNRDFLAACAVTLAVGLVLAQGADKQDSDQVSALLRDAKAQAHMLSDDASAMEAFTRGGATWESHASAVEQMRSHVNETGRILAKLQDQRGSASSWQLVAVDRIAPLLKESAANTDAVIRYLSANPKRLALEEYKNHIEANADSAAGLASLISDFVDYGRSKRRMEQLAAKLEIPTP